MKDAQGHGSNPRGRVHAYNHWLQPDGTYKYGRKGSKAARYVESGAAAAAHQCADKEEGAFG